MMDILSGPSSFPTLTQLLLAISQCDYRSYSNAWGRMNVFLYINRHLLKMIIC